MLSAETMKWRLANGWYDEFELVFWTGKAQVVSAGDTLSLLVRGKRADYTWDRVRDTWLRLHENWVLTVDELGGQHDAVGLVSLFAALGEGDIEVSAKDGMLRLAGVKGRPVRPDPGPMVPRSWAPLKRKISGN